MAVTLKDIAEACEVSKRTVSEILNRKGKPYSPATVERVFAAAERLGYRPNAQARAVASGRVGTIALVLGEEHYSHLPQKLLHGIHDRLAAADYKLMVTVLSDDQLGDIGFIPEILRTLVADGMLINYHYRFPPHLLEAIDRYRVPAVWINVHKDHDAACFDEAEGARLATRRLLELGHRRIAYIDRALEREELHYSSVERRDAYLATMAEAGCAPRLITGRDPGLSALVERWSGADDRPTACVCYNLHTAQDIATAAAYHGWRVPADLSLVTFGHTHHGVPHVDAYDQPWRHLGEVAADLLLRRLESDDPLPCATVPLEWLPGNSLGPPPGD